MQSSAEIVRQAAHAVPFGTVEMVEGAQVRVRVGDILTDWIPAFALAAGEVSHWRPISVGEQVLLLAPNGDPSAGAALRGLYSDAFGPPSTSPDIEIKRYRDGAEIEYDQAAHVLRATLPQSGTAEITASGGVTIHGPLKVNGATTLNGDVEIDGDTATSGDIVSDGDVIASDVSLVNHPHDKVQTGTGISGKPVSSTPSTDPPPGGGPVEA